MRRLFLVLAGMLCAAIFAGAQDSFRWVDFHSDKDQSIVIWVTKALEGEKWSAIREIGVQYDQALVVTTLRAAADASPAADTFQIYNISLKSHLLTPVLKGVNLRWLDGLQLVAGTREPAVLYDDCSECAATTYLTAFHYDLRQHIFVARWLRGTQGVPVWTNATQADVTQTQVYAVLPVTGVGDKTGAGAGSEFLAVWNHFDFGKAKPEQDYVFRYDRDPQTGLDRFMTLGSKDADAMKVRLCGETVQGAGLARGQDSDVCVGIVPHARTERRVVTTPPANAQGRSAPPGSKPKHN